MPAPITALLPLPNSLNSRSGHRLDQGVTILAISCHEFRWRCRRQVMRGTPIGQFHQGRHQRNCSGCRGIDHPPPVTDRSLAPQQSRRFQPLQSCRKDIGRNPLARSQKLGKPAFSVQHGIAQDQQAEAIAKDFQTEIDRAARARRVPTAPSVPPALVSPQPTSRRCVGKQH